RLSFNSSRLPRTSRSTSAATVAADADANVEDTFAALLWAGASYASAVPAPAAVAATTCGRRRRYTNPSAKIAANPPTRIHFKLSSRAGIVVAVAVAASPPASAREFTDGSCDPALPAPRVGIPPPLPPPPPAPPPCDEDCIGAVPDIFTISGVFAATDSRIYALKPCSCPAGAKPSPVTVTPGGAKTASRATGYGDEMRNFVSFPAYGTLYDTRTLLSPGRKGKSIASSPLPLSIVPCTTGIPEAPAADTWLNSAPS